MSRRLRIEAAITVHCQGVRDVITALKVNLVSAHDWPLTV